MWLIPMCSPVLTWCDFLLIPFMGTDDIRISQVTGPLQLDNSVIFAVFCWVLLITWGLALSIHTVLAWQFCDSCSSPLPLVWWLRGSSPGTELWAQGQHPPCSKCGQSSGLILFLMDNKHKLSGSVSHSKIKTEGQVQDERKSSNLIFSYRYTYI